jgi:hypothetical protein
MTQRIAKGFAMALARLKRQPEKTVGKGNCAFNAFALALCDKYVFLQIEQSIRAAGKDPDVRFAGFIRQVAERLKITNDWQSVKTALLQLRADNPVELQAVLAPILRERSMIIALDPIEYVRHIDQTYQPLISAFDDFRLRYSGNDIVNNDDIFSRHRFIQDKFDDVCRVESDDVLQYKIVDNWWWKEGYKTFIKEMSQDGAWAGDLELARLACYFDVVLKVVRDDFEHTIHGNYGSFPLLHGERDMEDDVIGDIMLCLYNRDIIARKQRDARHDSSYKFSIADFNLLIKRLSKIPDCEKVCSFVESNFHHLKGMEVPKWTSYCLSELIQRNVIGRGLDGKNYIFSIDAGEALLRINKIPCYQKIIAICRANYKCHPLLVLHNKGMHWENTVTIIWQEEQLYRRIGLFLHHPPLPVNDFGAALLPGNVMRRNSDEDVVRRLT